MGHPYSEAVIVVRVGVDRETITDNEARLLLHEAADALVKAGGPMLSIYAPFVDPDKP